MVGGSTTIGAANGAMTINQNSDRAIINWNSFSIGAPNSVTFNQPNTSSAVLNRVTGDTTSVIAGRLSANGQVFLVNPNGIAITSSGRVDVGGGFVASSLNIRNRDFMDGNLSFSGNGGAVSNAGSINVGTGGFAALIGGSVSNSGTINVPQGRVALGAGTRATLDLTGDGFLQIASAGGGNGSGTRRMTGGQLRQAVRDVVNMPGSAHHVSGHHGRIVLGGGGQRLAASKRVAVADAGTVTNSGTITASAGTVVLSGKAVTVANGLISTASATGKGGSIVVTATDAINLRSAGLDASGATGGGSIKIGGDYQGTGSLPRAKTLTVDAGSSIRADAVSIGNGGRIILWSDDKTVFNGQISARGGAQAGNGGFAEVSSKGTLVYNGLADLRAAHGNFGDLLLDPYNITISTGADSNSGNFTASGNDSVINVTTLINALNYANVEVKTGAPGSAGTQAGNITLTTPLMWSTRATLTLSAASNIFLNGAILAPNGRLDLNAGGDITSSGDINVGTFVLNSGAWTQKTPTLPRFEANDFRLNGGSFLRATGGAGTIADPYVLVDVYGLQGMNTFLAGNFALGADIDARKTATWNANWFMPGSQIMRPAGFIPIGSFFGRPFTGTFDGRGHLISNLTINRQGDPFIGLFGYTNNATLKSFGLEKASITGGEVVGGVVGRMDGGRLAGVYSTGNVRGSLTVGGLVGANNGTITDSYSSITVGAIGLGSAMGGLVGFNGRLGTIINAYALGSVSGNADVGGLVGLNFGLITSTYASGKVNGPGGGLLGRQEASGTLSNSVWDSDSTGQGSEVGFDAGTTTNVNSVDGSNRYTLAPYTNSGFDFQRAWVLVGNDSVRPMLRSEYSTIIRNAHQLQLMSMAPFANYTLGADIDASATNGANASDIWSKSGFAPMADYFAQFDGQMHVIDKLTINRPQQDGVGLFGALRSPSSVSNLGVTNAAVIGHSNVGILAGNANGKITNVYSTGTVTATGLMAGGLVGLLEGTANVPATISNSYSSATVKATNDGAGGLAGFGSKAEIVDSYAIGAVRSDRFYAGGLVGILQDGRIKRSYASGPVSALATTGGLAAVLLGLSSIENSYWDKDSTGQGKAADNVANAPGGIDASNRYNQATYAGFDFANTWFMLPGFTRPFLRSEYSTSIHNAHQLQLMAMNLNANYTLANNIDASATAGSNASDMWSPAGFVPVRTDSTPFNGSLRGFGFSIDNLTINAPGLSNAGLFGFTGNDAFISVDLNNATIRGLRNVGGIAGTNNGTIVSSNVRNSQVTGGRYAGGVAGLNQGQIVASTSNAAVTGNSFVGGLVGSNSGAILGSSASGAVTGTVAVGGLVGENLNPGRILASFATGNVQGIEQVLGLSQSITSIGGLAGFNNGIIELAYATGDVSTDLTARRTPIAIGGLVGKNFGSLLNVYAWGNVKASNATEVGGIVGQQLQGSITNAYYGKGRITGGSFVGGLVGVLQGSLTNAYWDTQTSGIADAIGTNLGAGTLTNVAGYNTAKMQNLDTIFSTYKGFDFQKVWWPASNAQQNGLGQGYYPEFYMLSYVLTYKPDDVTVTYGAPRPLFDPKLYGVQPPGSFPPGFFIDTQAIKTSASGRDNAGSYRVPVIAFGLDGPVIQGDDGQFYRVLTLPANYTVKPLEVPVTANSGTSPAGSSPNDPGLRQGAILPGDDQNLVFGGLFNSFGINANTAPGAYILSVFGQGGDPNYVLVRFDGTWVVTPAAPPPPPVTTTSSTATSAPATSTVNTPAPGSFGPISAVSTGSCSAVDLARRLRTDGKVTLIKPRQSECSDD